MLYQGQATEITTVSRLAVVKRPPPWESLIGGSDWKGSWSPTPTLDEPSQRPEAPSGPDGHKATAASLHPAYPATPTQASYRL